MDSESTPLPPRSFKSFSAGKNKAHREQSLVQNNGIHPSKSQTSLLPSLPAAAEPLRQSSMSKSFKRHDSSLSQSVSTNEVSKKLLCCLKVEIKNGIYKMLPVHDVRYLHDLISRNRLGSLFLTLTYTQKDDPHQLAFMFCRTNNLISSVSHLTEHIRQSKKTYGSSR
jgi:hypothetical protein